MTLTLCDAALASMAAPEPESRLTSSSTFAPLVMACSACCCCVDLSPCAFWIWTGTPACWNAFCSSGRSTWSQRTEDCVSGSSTATLPGFEPPDELLLELLLLLELPQPATTTAAPTESVVASQAARFMVFLLQGVWDCCLIPPGSPVPGGWGRRGRPPTLRGPGRRAPGRAHLARPPRPPRCAPPRAGPPGRRTRGCRRAAGRPRRRDR